jgi:DNA-binding transcriptional MocR family regulator
MTLNPNAKALLLAVWERHNGLNNGEISYSVREASAIGLSKDQASRAFAQLTERGFLKIHRNSVFDLKTKEARTWELAAESCDGNSPSRDFMRWSPTPSENKTRSHQRDAQSHQRDTLGADVIKLPTSVAPARPSKPISTDSRSHQRDTYILPGGIAK